MNPTESNSRALVGARAAGRKRHPVHSLHQAQPSHLMTVEFPHVAVGSCGSGEAQRGRHRLINGKGSESAGDSSGSDGGGTDLKCEAGLTDVG